MRLSQRLLAMATAMMLSAPAAHAQLTFDDLPAAPGCGTADVSNGYGGLNWNNVSYLAGPACSGSNGYINGTLTSPYVAFNGFGNLASFGSATPFTWSAYFTAAWRNNLDVTIAGTLNGNAVYTQNFQLGIAAPTLLTFSQAVDFVTITTANGVNPGNLGGDGLHVAFDNMTVNTNVVPEPATLVLMSAGLGLVALVARRRRA